MHLAEEEVIADILHHRHSPGARRDCRFLDTPFEEILTARPKLVAVLAHVRDPGNAGTVLRCADAAGAEAVVLTDASVIYNPKAVRASVGSLFHLPVAVGVPVRQPCRASRTPAYGILAADGAGEDDRDDELDKGTMGGPTAWVLNEAWGLPGGDARAGGRRRARTDPTERPESERRRPPPYVSTRPPVQRASWRVPLRHRQLVG